jgi:CRISPR/Cas system CSM-associated protein Csm2 small subunit
MDNEIEKLQKQNNLTTSEIRKLLAYHKDEFKHNEENYNDKQLHWHHSDAIEMYSQLLKKH